MIWYICFGISILLVLAAIAGAILVGKSGKSSKAFTPFNLVLIGVAAGLFVSMIPIYSDMLAGSRFSGLKLVLFSLLQTVEVFTVNVDSGFILDYIKDSVETLGGLYSVYETILFVVAPALTLGFVASLFKNAFAAMNYVLHRWGDVYVFSELNEKSSILVEDIRKNHRGALLVFTNVDKDEGDVVSEYIAAAKKLNALIFKKDILSVNFLRHSRKAKMTFFVIGESENENLRITQKLLSRYKDRENTDLYVFSTGKDSELLLANADYGKVKLRRINEARSLVYDFLYNEGVSLFENAKPLLEEAQEDGEPLKRITAVLVGMQKAGLEMLKALSWYGQMAGYTLALHAFDEDPLAEDKFTARCPELMTDPKHEYNITFHSGVSWETSAFADQLRDIPGITFVFVSLGEDNQNIACAAEMRMLCERMGCRPDIRTVVRSDAVSRTLATVTNYQGQAYGIRPMGSWRVCLTEKILTESEPEQLALQTHLRWGKEEAFWQYEYNYRSSMASAIHQRAKLACNIPGAGKEEEKLTAEERDLLERVEHRRWSAYLRSEGYVYSGSPEKTSRNDLARMHHNLVEFDDLTEEDKRKDSRAATK